MEVISQTSGNGWVFYCGDCVTIMHGMPGNSVDLTVTSCPFGSIYIYSDSDADVGNAIDKATFMGHMRYVVEGLLRITVPGRCVALHIKDMPLFLNRDGAMGIDPLSDDLSELFRSVRLDRDKTDSNGNETPDILRDRFVLQSRVMIWKDPVIEMEKTNSHGLLFKTWRERAELLRTGLPDYVLLFQKVPDIKDNSVIHDPLDLTYYGDNPPADHRYPHLPSRKTGRTNLALPTWQEYASPVWFDVCIPPAWADVNQMDVLNVRAARNPNDERHICPMPLNLIERLIHWKSNPGEVVFDPFGGIGSTGVAALGMHRKTVLCELKPDYHKQGTKYLQEADTLANQPDLFSWAEAQAKERYERITSRAIPENADSEPELEYEGE